MRFLVFIFIILSIAAWVGLKVAHDTGYVFIAYNHWSAETSLWVGIGIIIVVFIALYTLLRLIVQTSRLPNRLSSWKRMRRYREVRQTTQRGFCELITGDWQKAEQSLLKAAKLSQYSLIHYLFAAKAAQALQAFDRRDDYLRQAHLSAPHSEIVVGITQAELQIESGQWEQAMATLKYLHQLSPKQVRVLELLKRTCLNLNDWTQLKSLIPQLKKAKLCSVNELKEWEENFRSR